MHDYGVPTEVVRMALAFGIIVSILIYERWRVTGGAAVVAGYLALFVNRPLYIITTVVLAIATYQIVQRFIARRMFLYGRRRLVVMVLIGMVLQLITGAIAFALNFSAFVNQATPWMVGLYGVGFVLPGLIAQDIERQGSRLTILAVVGTTLLTFLILRNLEAIKTNLPIFWNSIAFEDKTFLYSYHTQLLSA
jgi:poly-gamma-glutamate biosynthesis protein PgsC/CapC